MEGVGSSKGSGSKGRGSSNRVRSGFGECDFRTIVIKGSGTCGEEGRSSAGEGLGLVDSVSERAVAARVTDDSESDMLKATDMSAKNVQSKHECLSKKVVTDSGANLYQVQPNKTRDDTKGKRRSESE